MTKLFALAAAMILTTNSAALAHHPLGGMTPTSFTEGFLSGLGHPVIGFDHLAFVVAVGLIATFHRNLVLMPAAFVVGTVGGALLTLAAVTLPLAELVITGSVIAGGAFVMRGRVTDLRVAGALIAGVGVTYMVEIVEAVIFPAM